MASFLLILTLISISGASDSRQTVPVKEVMAEIGGHKTVSYESVIIDGDLILDGASSGSIVHPITVIDCDIEGDVRFDNAVLARPINFERTRFNGSVSFDGTRFLGCANFSRCDFRRSASFRGAMFRGPTSFGRAIFRSFSTFREAVFDGTLADFHASDFQDYASFNFASFHVEKADFEGSMFEGDANFQQAEFKGRAVFLGSAFMGLADFDRSRFNSTSEFLGSRFYDELHLNGVDYNVFDITWDSIRHRLVCDEPGYIALITNFKSWAGSMMLTTATISIVSGCVSTGLHRIGQRRSGTSWPGSPVDTASDGHTHYCRRYLSYFCLPSTTEYLNREGP